MRGSEEAELLEPASNSANIRVRDVRLHYVDWEGDLDLTLLLLHGDMRT